jgi:hypothetical protein
MAPHKLFCYAPHRLAVREFLHTVNPHFNDDNLVAIRDEYALRGQSHVNFIIVVGMEPAVPQNVHQTLRRIGAVLIELDDTYERMLARVHHPEPASG